MMASCAVLTVKKLLKTRVMKINPPIANGIRTSASIACLPATDRWVTSELYRKADEGNVAILWTGGNAGHRFWRDSEDGFASPPRGSGFHAAIIPRVALRFTLGYFPWLPTGARTRGRWMIGA